MNNKKDVDVIIHGLRVGEYGNLVNWEDAIPRINEKIISQGMNYVNFQLTGIDMSKEIPQHYFLEWAEYLAKNKIYFSFGGGGDRQHAGFTHETAKKMKEIAGEYFLAYILGEEGSVLSCKASGYWCPFDKKWENLQDAKDYFVNTITEHAEGNSMGCGVGTTVTESTSMTSYECEAGVTYPTIETWVGDVEIGAAFTRGAARAYNCPMWATYLPHNWYAGLYNADTLKVKRFRMGYDYFYLAGASVFQLESADEKINTHGDDWGYDNPYSEYYRRSLSDFAKFTKNDGRPVGGPKVKVAFVRGNLDGYSFRHSGGSLWRGHKQKEYGYSAPEYTWRILDTIKTKRNWADIHNVGEVDLSGAPAYGNYDVIPATVGADIFCKYDYLIFVGWNTMTDEIYDNLKKFVEQGGRLLMTAAHLNTNNDRSDKIELIKDGKVSDLFGCNLDAKNMFCTEDGNKFMSSIVPEFLYPRSRVEFSDPYFADGYINYAKAELTTGVPTARLANRFREEDVDSLPASLVENKCGEGYAMLMTTLEYPSGAGFQMYQTLVREIITASHRLADIKVYGADSLKFAVYEGDKVYLFNSDFDNKIFATIDYGTHKVEHVLNPGELKAVEKEEFEVLY